MAKILFFDIETAPNIGYTWGKWEQNVIEFVQESYMLCYAYSWGEGKVKVVGLNDFDDYVAGSNNDYKLAQSLWELLNEADVVIAHNGKQFDIKAVNERFLYHGIEPPSNYQVVDTLLTARNKFKCNSNKLNDLGLKLKLGKKTETGGFALWLGCMAGEEKSWSKMKKYNRQDVVLLRLVYHKLKGWMNNHPNINTIDQTLDKARCSVCGSDHVIKAGFDPKGTTLRQRWKCLNVHCKANLYTNLKEALPLKNG